MLLKVGELARRSGLTVRTLHHYDAIGLLSPSARTEAGYRLYTRDDVARLHRIQALRRFGMSLADIGNVLADPSSALLPLVEQQMRMLDAQIAQASRLRERLSALQGQLTRGDEPDLADWLTTLELMTMYDKYFTPEELARLPLYHDEQARETDWPALVADVQALMASGAPAESDAAQALAKRWMTLVDSSTGHDATLLLKLTQMQAGEPSQQAGTGISAAMMDYVLTASAQTRMAIYAKYLTPEETAFMRANFVKSQGEWPALIADVRTCMAAHPPASPEALALARRWMALFRTYAGDNPETHAKFRLAHEREPALMEGSLVDGTVIDYIKQAMMHARPTGC